MRLRCVSENRFGGFFRACHRVFATRDLSNDDGAVDKEKQLLRKQFRVFETGSTSKALKVVRYEGLVVGSHAMNWITVIPKLGRGINTCAAIKLFAFDPAADHVETREQP